jgi:hypothetical protein
MMGNMSRKKKLIFIAPLAGLGMALIIFIGGEIVMHLWNWNLPQIFGWREITFWQAIGLFALCRILFGGSGPIGRGHSGMRRRIRDRIDERIDERMSGRWANMSPEERERFRQGMRGCCGWGPPAGEAPSGGKSAEGTGESKG